MLRWDVVHAAQNGKFHIYAVNTVDEALELLSDIEAGIADEREKFPAVSFNGKIDAQLQRFTTLKQAFSTKDSDTLES